jgi:hypothetical protein
MKLNGAEEWDAPLRAMQNCLSLLGLTPDFWPDSAVWQKNGQRHIKRLSTRSWKGRRKRWRRFTEGERQSPYQNPSGLCGFIEEPVLREGDRIPDPHHHRRLEPFQKKGAGAGGVLRKGLGEVDSAIKRYSKNYDRADNVEKNEEIIGDLERASKNIKILMGVLNFEFSDLKGLVSGEEFRLLEFTYNFTVETINRV